MPKKTLTANEIRQQFIDFFVDKYAHTFVASSSLVPGGDSTLLFTNSGMVQFKDVFLGTDDRPYTRAVNSQKCLRVAGKHNDLEDVGFDDTHHTFFEMLGNWSFGDYYKKEAIEWAWELLTEVWKLPKDRLYVTCFKDEQGEIPTDDEAASHWRAQPGLNPDHILYFGRKDNFWEMADTGPCGPNSEIHIDLGPEHGEITFLPDGTPDLDGPRFLELWNLVFMQYNRTGPKSLEPLPATHVDTGMGFERIVAVLQNQPSNYRTDLFWSMIEQIQELARHSDKQREESFTPYRVIADHVRAASFLIADGVVPGNLGRNYVARMVIRRAARFGGKIGLNEPFLAHLAANLIDMYGGAYPELVRNRAAILDNLTREEERFQRTVEGGIANLEGQLNQLSDSGSTLSGEQAFELYATFGLPLEITRDVARERGLDVDEEGFRRAMEEHRLASGGGKSMGALGGEDVAIYRSLLQELQSTGALPESGVAYDPYQSLTAEGDLLGIIRDGESVKSAANGDDVIVILPNTCFYIASGGQIADTGTIQSKDGKWLIAVTDVFRPAAGIVAHAGVVKKGKPTVGDSSHASVNAARRLDIMRNHTATHLLHAALHQVVGGHARQAGSLVAPDRLRFDFNHSEPVTPGQLAEIEAIVNRWILESHHLRIENKPLDQAKAEGAMALFGEKYAAIVRTIQIGDENTFSYELCGGTHVPRTGDIGLFLITSESSAAAGIRRIEAITGRETYDLVRQRNQELRGLSNLLNAPAGQLLPRVESLLAELAESQRAMQTLRRQDVAAQFEKTLASARQVNGAAVLAAVIPHADRDSLRELSDRFRQQHPSGVVVLAAVLDGQPALLAAVTDDLVKRGLHAGELVKVVAEPLGGSGGGKPSMAQAGGKDASRLEEALALVLPWVEARLNN
ncbi:MAG: alanine--tRNA ligase [Anaerolineae bacterium]|nr:MAG: alanine--tRNA ligase [Anaerolineae bacterium]